MEIVKNLAVGKSVTYQVSGIDTNGSPAEIGTPVFTVESGTATISDGPNANSKTITATDSDPSTILVEAPDSPGSTTILSVTVQLNPAVVVPPVVKAVSLVLTEI